MIMIIEFMDKGIQSVLLFVKIDEGNYHILRNKTMMEEKSIVFGDDLCINIFSGYSVDFNLKK